MKKIIGMVILYLLAFVIIVVAVFCGIRLYKEIKAESYINGSSEPKTWAAFLRRITAVYNFDISKDTPVSKHTGEIKKPPMLIPIDDDSDLPF